MVAKHIHTRYVDTKYVDEQYVYTKYVDTKYVDWKYTQIIINDGVKFIFIANRDTSFVLLYKHQKVLK